MLTNYFNEMRIMDGRIRNSIRIDDFMTMNVDIISDIVNVEVIKDSDGKDRKVIVYFADGTNERAVVCGNDSFNLEIGISICITKKLLTDRSGSDGNKLYNKIIKRAVKVRNDSVAKYKKDAEELERIERKKAKKAAQKALRVKKKEEQARESRIQEQAEAYARALRMVEQNRISDLAKNVE